MEIQGKVGIQLAADGTLVDPRLTKQGAQLVGDGHGHFYEANYRGLLFTACLAAAGAAPGTALGTAPPIALWNPPNSGKNLVLTKAVAGYISGTLGAGSIVYAACPQALAPTGGTKLVPISNQIGNGATPAGQAFTGSTIQATATIVRPAFILGAFAGAAGEPAPGLVDLPDGELIVLPGYAVCLQGIAAAGTSPLMLLSLTWQEEPV